jgi:hypothetical protein
MYRFRLKSATVAVQQGHAAMIPSGAEIAAAELPDAASGYAHSTFVTVEWEGKVLRMFLIDLLERGERMDSAADGRK